ncbi:MAG: cation transporter [Burkholderiaceae bacterium]|jgi:cation diffusion facilitator family transporter|nr:cation transporter [Alphaproteobacteria bacterium]
MVGCKDSCGSSNENHIDEKYKRILYVCLIANAVMFGVQTMGSYEALSVSLLANALDFLSDAANYAISLFVLGKSLQARAKASYLKGVSLGLIGLWVAFETLQHALQPELPKPEIMTVISIVGLAVNIGCAVLLYRHRGGDSNRESVWICSRNDAIGNIAVIFAAGGVFASATAWPDIIVAAILGYLALSGAWQILRAARKDLNTHREKKNEVA